MTAAPELSGIIDGRYRVDGAIGKGGFGDVYAGLHLVLGVRVAIKVLRLGEGLSADQRAELVTRFLDEGRLLTRLRHPNVVAALDLGLLRGDSDGVLSPYLVMEWVEGETLAALLAAREDPFTLAEAWALFEPLAEALAHAHGAGVVHRDLKPANVMVGSGAPGTHVPRVIDFGVAKLVAPDDAAGHGWTETTSRSPFTPAYAAPEQVTQSRTGPWTDVHALALLFVELVTGVPPYGERNNARIAAVDPARPTPRAAGVDVGALEPVIAKALALRPSERYANASELLAAARAAMRTMDIAPHAPAEAAPRAATAATASDPPRSKPDTTQAPAARAPSSLGTQPDSHAARTPAERPAPTPQRHALASLPTVSQNPTAPPASHTLASVAPRSTRVSRRGVFGASAIAGIAVAITVGFVVAPRLRASQPMATASTWPPLPVASIAAPPLGSLTLAELGDRIRHAGVDDSIVKSDSGPPLHFRTVSWVHGFQSWSVTLSSLTAYGMPAEPTDAERLAAVAIVVKGYRASGVRGMYAYDSTSIVVMQTSGAWGEDDQRIAAAVFAGVAFLAQEPLRLPIADAGGDTPSAAPAKHLRDLTSDELASRLARHGVKIAGTLGGPFDSSTISFMNDASSGVAYIGRHDAKSTLEAYRRGVHPFVYAVDGDLLVVVLGGSMFTTKRFLTDVLSGLGAKVEEGRH